MFGSLTQFFMKLELKDEADEISARSNNSLAPLAHRKQNNKSMISKSSGD